MCSVTAKDLLAVAEGKITEEGLLWNVDVGLQYLESWLRGWDVSLFTT